MDQRMIEKQQQSNNRQQGNRYSRQEAVTITKKLKISRL